MSFQDLYQQKRCTAEEALDVLKDGDYIIVPTGVGEPPALLTALSEHRRRFHDITVAQILAVKNTVILIRPRPSMYAMWLSSLVLLHVLAVRLAPSILFLVISLKCRC